jgi:glycosyltransferase involved in cell wall biosynthesis
MNSRLCISFIDRSLWWGGAEASLRWLAAGLDRRGHDVEIVVDFPLPHHVAYVEAGLRVTPRMDDMPWWAAERRRLPLKGLDRLGVELRARTLERHLAGRRPDVVHLNLFRSRSRVDVDAARRSGATVIGHLRQLGHQAMPQGVDFDLCDHVIAVSEFVAGQARARGCRRPIVTIYDGIEPERFAFPGTAAAARRRLGLPADGRILGFPAALEPRKGQDVALAAFLELARDMPDVRLVFAGGRTTLPEAQAYVTGLVRDAMSAGLAERVRFLGPCEDMAAFYAASDVVLALSRDGEAFGRVAAEAAVAARPVVATGLGATPEVVQDGVTGLLVPAGEPEATGRAVRALLVDEAARLALGNRARGAAEARFGSENALERFGTFYRDVRAGVAA